MKRFLFVSAENDALHGCKAGGMGDVVRDVPREISNRGDEAAIVVPAYNRLHKGAALAGSLEVNLRGQQYALELYEVTPKKLFKGLKHYVIHHPEIQAGDIAHLYHHDPEEPFYNDFIKYAIFCAGVAEAIKTGFFGKLEVVHLHDWHSSLLLALREFHPDYKALQPLRFVYSIHNLAIQGIRPFEDNYSSVSNWFPQVDWPQQRLRDPRYTDCINLMAVGIRFADAVHTVSPSYREDIMKPSNPPEFIGGEGLEDDLRQAHTEGRLFGILNGCNYANIRGAERGAIYYNTLRALFGWLQEESKKYKADFLAHTGEKVLALLKKPPKMVCSSVARLTEQKFYFFYRNPERFKALLAKLEKVEGIFMLLGTGAPEYEELFRRMSYEHPNFIFTNGQSEDLIDSIYLESDLYVMPSLFEPCGISQMLSMRNGNPVLAHATGGLIDTIRHQQTGFLFEGSTYTAKLDALDQVFDEVLELFFNHKERWAEIQKNAAAERFTWTKSLDSYYTELYEG